MRLPGEFVLIGAKATMPRRFVVTAQGCPHGPAQRETLDRLDDEADDQFWLRVARSALLLAHPRSDLAHCQSYGAVVMFEYEPATTREQAAEDDRSFNLQKMLWFTADHDPCQRIRVWALLQLQQLGEEQDARRGQ